jgi:hypothetical protein
MSIQQFEETFALYSEEFRQSCEAFVACGCDECLWWINSVDDGGSQTAQFVSLCYEISRVKTSLTTIQFIGCSQIFSQAINAKSDRAIERVLDFAVTVMRSALALQN